MDALNRYIYIYISILFEQRYMNEKYVCRVNAGQEITNYKK